MVVGARERHRANAARSRLGLLTRIAEVAEDRPDLTTTARRLADVLVPDVADACVIDIVDDGVPRRLAVRVDGPDGDSLARVVARAPVSAADVLGTGRLGGGGARLVSAGTPAGADDLALLREIGGRSAAYVPLRIGGRPVGLVRLVRTSRTTRRFAEADVPFVETVAERMALVLENAGLSSELAAAEHRLGVALGAMDAAVLVQRPGRGIVYANEAAAQLMGLPSPEAVVAATPEEIADHWDVWHEDGTPLSPGEYPSHRILTGENLEPPPLVSRGVHRETGEERWLDVKATAILDDQGQVEMAVSISEDITALKRAELTQRVLAEAGAALSSSFDDDATLQAVAQVAVPELADWCTVTLRTEAPVLRLAAVAHRDPENVAFARRYAERFALRADASVGSGEVLRTGAPQLHRDVPDDLLEAAAADEEQLEAVRAMGIRSAVQVPLLARGGDVLGVLSLINAESGRVFTPADLALAQELGRRAGLAIETARLYAERSRIAATLQRSLLPDQLPEVPGVALASVYRPAGEENWVGGDFYDAFVTPAGWMVTIGDVAGHGAPAAALTAQTRHALRSAGMLTGDPAAAVAHLNELLMPRETLALCTVCAVLLPPAGEEGPARVVSAGHPRPILVRDGETSEVADTSPLVGAWDVEYHATDVELSEGDVLVLYTDGVLDARRGAERFGAERLHAALRGAANAVAAVSVVERVLDAFQTGEQADDTAILAIERLAVAAGSTTERDVADQAR